MKKFLSLISCAITVSTVLHSQEIKIPVSNAKAARLMLVNLYTTGAIEGYDGNEIIIARENFKPSPERAKNMTPIYAAGNDNTGIGLNVDKTESVITITGLVPHQQHPRYHIRVPQWLMLSIQCDCFMNDTLFVKNLKNNLEVRACYSVNVRNIEGAILVSNSNGVIDVALKTTDRDWPVSLVSFNAEIDVTLPAHAKASIEMNSVNGNVYSDFKINTPSAGKEKTHEQADKIKLQLSQGGPSIKITNSSGDIYLRKG